MSVNGPYRFRPVPVRWALAGAVAATGLLGQVGIASGDACSVSGKDCTFTISNSSIQKVPTLLKLQAQISQAKMPVGDAEFAALQVRVLSGSTLACTEKFEKARVRSGVLNLEIGRAIDCPLDDVIAKHNDLVFQICIGASAGDPGSCLKPIQMSSVPYALKSNFASQAQESYRAELASRANYAQRLTADGIMLQKQELGAGYYDFQSPGTTDLAPLQSEYPAWASEIRGGFMQWAPTDASGNIFNISGKNINGSLLARLSGFVVHATRTSIIGSLRVSASQEFIGTSTFRNSVSIVGPSLLEGGLNVAGGVANIRVPATFGSGNSSMAVTLQNGVTFEAASATSANLPSASFSSGSITVGSGVNVNAANAAQVTLPGATLRTSDNTIAVNAGVTVNMQQAAQVLLPNNLRTPPSIVAESYTAANASGCIDATASADKVFCALVSSQQVAVSGSSCTIGKNTAGTNFVIRACKASCTISCF